MPNERRQNDQIILEKLETIQVNLALNTQATQNGNEQLRALNGKVAAHESRLQAIEGAQAITSTTLAQIQTNAVHKEDSIRGWHDWALKGIIAVIVMLFYYLLTHAGNFPDFLNH